jgi:hypothetical protein
LYGYEPEKDDFTTEGALYIYGPPGKIAELTAINNETIVFYYITDYLRDKTPEKR